MLIILDIAHKKRVAERRAAFLESKKTGTLKPPTPAEIDKAAGTNATNASPPPQIQTPAAAQQQTNPTETLESIMAMVADNTAKTNRALAILNRTIENS